MKPIHVVAAAALMAGSSALAKDPPKAPEPTKAVDAATFFTGRWYEIARDPQKITDGCVAGTTDYQPDGKGGLYDRDACRDKTPDGKEKVVGGPLTILNPGPNNKVRVRYRLFGFVPVARTYWILDHAPGWFIQADPTLKHINIYTREARPSKALVDDLTARAKTFGYDPARLEFPATMAPGQR